MYMVGSLAAPVPTINILADHHFVSLMLLLFPPAYYCPKNITDEVVGDHLEIVGRLEDEIPA